MQTCFVATRSRDTPSKSKVRRSVERLHNNQRHELDESACGRSNPPEDQFVLDSLDGPDVTSDVSDADQCDEEDDDDWTEETVSVAHAEMEVGSIYEDELVEDGDSLGEEIAVEEIPKAAQPPAALLIPPLTDGRPPPEKKSVKEMIAAYNKYPASGREAGLAAKPEGASAVGWTARVYETGQNVERIKTIYS
jgi:hypothetical protein